MTPSPGWVPSLRSEIAPAWCATCGDFGALAALERALRRSGAAEEQLVVVGGPGCAGRLPRSLRGYRIEAPAGVALAVAAGCAAARPDLRVLVVTGDADFFAAGAAGLVALGRRDPNVVAVVLENGVAASSGRGRGPDVPALHLALASGASFVARGLASDGPSAQALLESALGHRGLAIVVLQSACPTFHREQDDVALRSRARALEADHDRSDRAAALRAAADPATLWTGVLFGPSGSLSGRAKARRAGG